MDQVAQEARASPLIDAGDGQTRQHGEGAVVGVEIEERRGDEESRVERADEARDPVDGRLAPGEHDAGHRLVGESEENGRGGGNAQLRKGGERLLAAPAAEPRAVAGPDAPPAFDQTLRPGVVLAIGGERDGGPSATRQGALQEAARGQRLVVGMRREEKHALPLSRSLPAHRVTPAPPKGENPRSAARAQITARGPSPLAGTNEWRPGSRSRGPS